jgi:hypothetical protein
MVFGSRWKKVRRPFQFRWGRSRSVYLLAWALAFSKAGTTPNCCINPSASHIPTFCNPSVRNAVNHHSLDFDWLVDGRYPAQFPFVSALTGKSRRDQLTRVDHLINCE